jgi:arginine exporter protein ArgO
MNARELSWKHVVVVLGFFGAIIALTLTGRDVATFVVVGMAILGGIGLVAAQSAATKEQTAAVQQQTNGNHTRLLDILERQGAMLAAMQPAPPIVVDATVGPPAPDGH